VSVRSAVILAAGQGLRLRDAVPDNPKGFVVLGGETLIERSIRQLRQTGIEDILIVSGFRSHLYEQLAERTPGVRTVENRQYDSTGSLFSLALALPLVRAPFLLLESDLLYEPRSLTELLSGPSRSAILASGLTHHGDEVFVDAVDSRFRRMSKDTTTLHTIVGEFVGITVVGASAASAIAEYARNALRVNPCVDYEESLNEIADSHEIGICKVEDLVWTEIDTPQHLDLARQSVLPRLPQREDS